MAGSKRTPNRKYYGSVLWLTMEESFFPGHKLKETKVEVYIIGVVCPRYHIPGMSWASLNVTRGDTRTKFRAQRGFGRQARQTHGDELSCGKEEKVQAEVERKE